MRFRDLTAQEVECRIGQVAKSGKGLSLLLYKDARCDANILDETVGEADWQSEFYEAKGTLFCRVGIYDQTKDEWVWKSDAGSPSNMEAVKGEASDAFKRACFKWGIGRELYTAPFIWVPSDKCTIVDGKCHDRFNVTDMKVKEGKIVELLISNDKGTVVYAFPRRYEAAGGPIEQKLEQVPAEATPAPQNARDYTRMTELNARYAQAKGMALDAAKLEIVGLYGNPSNMGAKEYDQMLTTLEAVVATMERGE